jgi:type II secretory pathway pseudopilin PulG
MKSLPPLSLARETQGFSLIELLVAMLSATVIAGALFAVLNFSTKETAALSDKVQADETGRTAMTKIVDELHSACVVPKFTPILEKSSQTNLRFIAGYSEKPSVTEVERHEIIWNKPNRTLTDVHTKGVGENGEYTFTEPSKETLIAANVSQNEETPIFQYFKYAEETASGEAIPVTTISSVPLTVPLSEKGEQEAASVLISFNTAPANGKTTFNRSLQLSSQVTFAFSVPNSETPIHDAPCQ